MQQFCSFFSHFRMSYDKLYRFYDKLCRKTLKDKVKSLPIIFNSIFYPSARTFQLLSRIAEYMIPLFILEQ